MSRPHTGRFRFGYAGINGDGGPGNVEEVLEHGDFIRFDVDMDWSYDLARPMQQQSRRQMHRPFTHAMGRSPQALSVQREVFISNAKAFFDGTYHGRGRTRRAP